MNAFLEPNDMQVIRGLLRSQKMGFAFLIYLTLTCIACFIACLIAVIDSLSPIFILLGFGLAILTYFLSRATLKNWKQVIHPLRLALRPGAKKIVIAGKLQSVSLSGKGKVMYEIDGHAMTTYPALLHNGVALLQEPLMAIETLLQHHVFLHLFEMPDGRKLLLDMGYTDLNTVKNTAVHRIISQTNIGSGILRYILYTSGYLVLLFIVLFLIPIGIILGVLPATVGYVIVLRSEMKRQRANKKLDTSQEIKGTITEIIRASARVQVMGESATSHDRWFRIDGKAYLIRNNRPLPPVALGDLIELVIS